MLPRTALQATAGPPRIPEQIRLRLTDGSECMVSMEDYLKGVVPTEMPALWPYEALQAQAVAARTYAASYVATYGYICSTTACQAWNPANRHPRSDSAVDVTRGVVMTYGGELIWSYYSSTCGGQTATSPDAASAYCQSVRCDPSRTPLNLGSDATAYEFYRPDSPPSAFCAASPHYRYTWSIGRAEAESILDRYLPTLSSASISPSYARGELGQLADLAVANRASWGKATRVRVSGASKSWEVVGETGIRSILRASPTGSAQRSANVVLNLDRDGSGITRVNGRGGGYGHAIGLCQYGANGMADAGYTYAEILQHYYSSVAFTTVSTSEYSVPAAGARRYFMPFAGRSGTACGG